MKIRQGFVANSSSSSFLVLIPCEWRDKMFKDLKRFVATGKQIELLESNGFKPTKLSTPYDIYLEYARGSGDTPFISGEQESDYGLCMSCSCNQDEIADFLLKHKIPFIASVHYGHETWVYERGKPYYTILENLGLNFEMYHSIPTFEVKTPIRRVKIVKEKDK